MTIYSSHQDFAVEMLRTTNCIERCTLEARALAGLNNKAVQLDLIHRAMNHRPHQADY